MDNQTLSTFFDLSTVLPTVVDNISKNIEKISFSWYDYILFCTMLALSSMIGIYFGCFGSRQTTTTEYLMGGKQMKVIPIVISLVASHTSGITLLAVPADVYIFGASYWLGIFSMLALAFITVHVYLPVFYRLQITSTYEYLERRFDNRSRRCASGLFALSVFVYLPIVTYIPALAFSAATGLNVHLITPVVCGVCIFYTTIGGLKAVVWTDTLQFTITLGALATVLLLGLKSAGGFSAVWEKSSKGERLDVFDFDFDPSKRETFWAIIVGLTIHWVSHTSVNQSCTQKFLSVPTLSDSKKSVYLYCIGMMLVKTACVFTGLIMFTKYSDCDPFTTHKVDRNDQLLPYYVLDVARSIPGLSGLFIAGVFSAALSTLSANLNCLAGTIYEDFLCGWLEKHHTHKTAGYILKLIVVCTGVISTAMVYVIENLGSSLLSLAIGLGSVAHGPILGMFTLGVLFPRANAKGAFYGAMTSVMCMAVIISGSSYYKSMGYFKYLHKPVSVDGCDFFVNETTTAPHPADDFQPMFLFRISFYWYTMTGALITLLVGLITSYLTNKNDPPVDKYLLSPVIHFLVEDNKQEKTNGKSYEYNSVQKALEVVTIGKETDAEKCQ